ncbi:hypothetical protein BST61_g9561 [Cercospora zeina]
MDPHTSTLLLLHHQKKPLLWTILFALIALTLHQLTRPPPPTHRPKVFVIGLSKTGTTSIGDALELLSYRRLGWRDIRSRHLVHTWANSHSHTSSSDYNNSSSDLLPTSLLAQTLQYDAFEDLPWSKTYPQLAEIYPDAKFILSLRKDDETWLRSMRTHMGRGEWQPYALFYGATTFEGNEEVIRQSYVQHTREVREFFRGKEERFVEMRIDDDDVGDEENWRALCRVAECPSGGGHVFPAAGIRFPRTNSKASWDMGPVRNAVRFCWGWMVTRTEEQVVKYYYERDVEAVKPVLNMLWMAYDFVERAYTELEFRIVALFVPALPVGQAGQ